eukprot:3065334-Prymnesium_polylepis.1
MGNALELNITNSNDLTFKKKKKKNSPFPAFGAGLGAALERVRSMWERTDVTMVSGPRTA